jgi:hypothetical protein
MAVDYNYAKGAQKGVLRRAMLEAFSRPAQLNIFLVENGFRPLNHVTADLNPLTQQAFELIDDLQNNGELNRFVGELRTGFPHNPAIKALEPPVLPSSKPPVAPVRKDNLERFVRNDGFEDTDLWHNRLGGLMRQVCRIQYVSGTGARGGSGFLIGADLVLTTWHVVEAVQKEPRLRDAVRVTFDYRETTDGPANPETCQLAMGDDWLVSFSPPSDADWSMGEGIPGEKELDYALIRLSSNAGRSRHSGIERGHVSLQSVIAPPAPGGPVYVLQHPGGSPLKHSQGVVLASPTHLRLRYDADTDGGSSGGLVVDRRLNPVALHQGSDPEMAERARYNQGIPLQLIAAAIATARSAASA